MVAIIQCYFQSMNIGEESFPSWAVCRFAVAGTDMHLSPGLISADLTGLCSPAVFFPKHLGHSLPFLIKP